MNDPGPSQATTPGLAPVPVYCAGALRQRDPPIFGGTEDQDVDNWIAEYELAFCSLIICGYQRDEDLFSSQNQRLGLAHLGHPACLRGGSARLICYHDGVSSTRRKFFVEEVTQGQRWPTVGASRAGTKSWAAHSNSATTISESCSQFSRGATQKSIIIKAIRMLVLLKGTKIIIRPRAAMYKWLVSECNKINALIRRVLKLALGISIRTHTEDLLKRGFLNTFKKIAEAQELSQFLRLFSTPADIVLLGML
ncbi:hypothetical protein HPB51_024420 [Rhipicephalus microplus]|uniref:Tick transposon n=1 Tax=Rhipicephalus microplus TaxID=6941 RepID=A0A9J6DJY0_RHIMP|nr:hypothetical protein HPB51_024420 [Rhipicephalus microplus]